MTRKLIATCALVLLLAGAAWAQAPTSIMYQGRLTDADGVPLAPPQDLTLRLFDVSTGGTHFYENLYPLDATTLDAQGMFMVELLSIPSIALNGGPLWLEIQVGSESPMTPRQKITSVPYAMSAGSAATVPTGSIGQAQIATNGVAAAEIAAGAVGTSEVANGSLTNADLGNETGLAFESNRNSLALTTAIQAAASATITIPTAGYVIAQGNLMTRLVHATGAADRIDISISQSATSHGTSMQFFLIQSDVGSGTFFTSLAVQNVYYYSTAGAKTIHMTAAGSFGTGHAVEYRDLILTFVPTAYGTVNEYSTTVPVEGAAPGTPPELITR